MSDKREYKEIKNACWVKDGKMYTIIKMNCKVCMNKRYLIRTWPETLGVKEVVSSCSCVREERMSKQNV